MNLEQLVIQGRGSYITGVIFNREQSTCEICFAGVPGRRLVFYGVREFMESRHEEADEAVKERLTGVLNTQEDDGIRYVISTSEREFIFLAGRYAFRDTPR
jgi:hypothetical protein